MRWAPVISLSLALGCAGAESHERPAEGSEGVTRQDEAGSTRASREAARTDEEGSVDPAVHPTAPESARPRLALHPLEDVEEAEDGRGAMVQAVRPVAIDLDARLVPVRARDPQLHIGNLVLHRYEYPTPDTLRFIIADHQSLPAGQPVIVRYGDRAGQEVVVHPALEVDW
ncbi:MAG: hypothetical protein AB7S26_10585 [Sandaracinaceae bacterium]